MIILQGIGLIPEVDYDGSWINANTTRKVFVKQN